GGLLLCGLHPNVRKRSETGLSEGRGDFLLRVRVEAGSRRAAVGGSGWCARLLAGVLVLAWAGFCFGQSANTTAHSTATANSTATATAEATAQAGATASLSKWKGLRVGSVEFEGVRFGAKDPLPGLLAQKAGKALEPAKVTASVRRLFASGRYRDIRVEGVREGTGMRLIYVGVPRYFVGRVTIAGVKDERLASLLEY